VALYNNGYRLGNTPFKRGLGALTTMYNGGGSVFNASMPTSAMRASYWLYGKQHGYPTGQLHPECWMLPQTGGAMSMRVVGQGAMSAGLIPSQPMSIDMTGSGGLAAIGVLVVSMLVNMAGSGSLSSGIVGLFDMGADITGDGGLSAAIQGLSPLAVDMTGGGTFSADLYSTMPMSVDMDGEGTLEAAGSLAVAMLLAMAGEGTLTAGIVGQYDMEVALSGQGDFAADMEGIANMVVELLGTGSLEATIAAFGNMGIDIVVTGTGLTTSNVGPAVWGALASANNEDGTMGNKLNTASSGGVDLNALADAVWEHNQAVTLNTGVVFLLKMIRNVKKVEKVDNVWTLVVYDDNGTTPILSKPLKDADGNDISDLAAGVLAQELAQGT
jgi:hypothetical protein